MWPSCWETSSSSSSSSSSATCFLSGTSDISPSDNGAIYRNGLFFLERAPSLGIHFPIRLGYISSETLISWLHWRSFIWTWTGGFSCLWRCGSQRSDVPGLPLGLHSYSYWAWGKVSVISPQRGHLLIWCSFSELRWCTCRAEWPLPGATFKETSVRNANLDEPSLIGVWHTGRRSIIKSLPGTSQDKQSKPVSTGCADTCPLWRLCWTRLVSEQLCSSFYQE